MPHLRHYSSTNTRSLHMGLYVPTAGLFNVLFRNIDSEVATACTGRPIYPSPGFPYGNILQSHRTVSQLSIVIRILLPHVIQDYSPQFRDCCFKHFLSAILNELWDFLPSLHFLINTDWLSITSHFYVIDKHTDKSLSRPETLSSLHTPRPPPQEIQPYACPKQAEMGLGWEDSRGRRGGRVLSWSCSMAEGNKFLGEGPRSGTSRGVEQVLEQRSEAMLWLPCPSATGLGASPPLATSPAPPTRRCC